MKANNLSISVPYKGCDKNCAYCISKMTNHAKMSSINLMRRNYEKVKNLAKLSQVSSVSITGKGEPTKSMTDIIELIHAFSEFPVELQTNGLYLLNNLMLVRDLYNVGLDVLAISLDEAGDFAKFEPLFRAARITNLTVRVTYNITKLTLSTITIKDFITWCKKYGVEQFSIRQVVAPTNIMETIQSKDAKKWIDKNVDPIHYERLLGEICKLPNKKIIRTLPYGATLYDIEGISVTAFDYCIQDNHGENDIRSLIFQEDGHVYASWNSLASRIL